MPELSASDVRQLIGQPTMLEVGCNDGTDTLAFLNAMPDIRLYCFEPDPRAIGRFKSRVADARVSLIEAAASDTDGEAVFHGSSGQAPRKCVPNPVPACHLLPEWDLSGSLFQPTGHLSYSPWVTFPKDREFLFKTVRLDTWLASHPELRRIDFLWADVQGAEAALVRGAQETLSICANFYTEVYETPLYENQPCLAEIQSLLPGGPSQWILAG